MKVAGNYTFEAPQQVVWDALQDPTVLTSVLPGCDRLQETGEHQYEGELNIKVGPVQGKFKGQIEMKDLVAPESFLLTVDGRGSTGFVKATAKVGLEPAATGTVMHYDSDAQVGGRIASVGQRLLDSSAKAIIQQSLDGLHEIMKSHVAQAAAVSPEGTAPSPPAYEAPTQAEFAAKVAKQVAKDIVPRPVLIGGLILILLIILFLLLT